MDNIFYTPLGQLPAKETVDFAKNLGFAYTFQSLAIVLTTPSHGISPPWTNNIAAGLITLLGGMLTAMVIDLYLKNWADLSARLRRLVFALGIAAGFLVSELTKARIAGS